MVLARRFVGVVLVYLGLVLSMPAGATGFVPALPVVGDVLNPYSLSAEALADTEDIERRGRTYDALSLATIIAAAEPASAEFSVLLVADDLAASVAGSLLDASYVAFTHSEEYSYGWEAVHLLHPASANIKRLQRIVVTAQPDPFGYGIHTISSEEHLHSTSIGGLYLGGWTYQYRQEGAASAARDGIEYISTVYSPLRTVDPSQVWGHPYHREDVPLRIWGSRGENYAWNQGMFTLTDSALQFRNSQGQVLIPEVVGTMVNPPQRQITDAYNDALGFLQSEGRALLLILDGFGYHQYEYALKNGHLPFLTAQPEAERASSVFQPVTNAGVSAILTGETPDSNGVFSRRQRVLAVPDIFDGAAALSRSAIYLAGDRQIVAASLEQKFHFDQTGSGSSDDDIIATAIELLGSEERPDLMVLHIKDIDRSGHSYGDLALETMTKIAEMDFYVQQLAALWSGPMIITADHGMHSHAAGGDHGVFCVEDMIVPYWLLEGAVQ